MDCCAAPSCGNLAAWRVKGAGVELPLCEGCADAFDLSAPPAWAEREIAAQATAKLAEAA